jgi:hypothetical protein
VFNVDYPLTSEITYNWNENVDNKLRRTIADTIITIDHTDSYHIEAQMYKDDNSIVLRVFDYGYHHACRNYEETYNEDGIRSGIKMTFPRPLVIYLDSLSKIPDSYSITLDFHEQDKLTMIVPVIKFQEKSLQEIIDKNLVIFLPFKLLKVRNDVKKAIESNDVTRIQNTIFELRHIYENDIIKLWDTVRRTEGSQSPNEVRIRCMKCS